MPVIVKLSGGRDKAYDDGEDIAVDDVGCLVVTSGGGKDERTIAVLAPGVWAVAEVV